MDILETTERVDIRHRLRAHRVRRLTIARMSAPDNWQAELRGAIAANRRPQPLLFSSSDTKLFLQSFAIFFTALMVFLF